jgi:uncharacterized OB-fold protein
MDERITTAKTALDAAEAKYNATPPRSEERWAARSSVDDASSEYRAAMRAAKHPHIECTNCGHVLGPRQVVVMIRRRYERYRHAWFPYCLRCVPGSDIDTERTQPCLVCGREIRYASYSWATSHNGTCSYQCAYRHKIAQQCERKRVHHDPTKCTVCGGRFVPSRSDARTCSNACRQKLYRQTQTRVSA